MIQKNCKNCGQIFEISDDDVAFYEKVSPVINSKKYFISPPTHCPECRLQRRMAWRNDRTFYHRTCDLTGAKFISMYAPDTKFPVYRQDAWHSDAWDGLAYGREFDFSKPFFEQWSELNNKVPHWGVAISKCENSDYCNYCTDEKNCYLDIAAETNEDCYYDHFVKYSKNCVDCSFVYHSTLCYECIQCYNCYNIRWSQYVDHCLDCAFCFDCKGCRNCVLSINLRNKEYYILNEPYTKEEYQQKLKALGLDRFSSLQNAEVVWKRFRLEKGIYRDMYNLNCQNCIGNDLKNSKNCYWCFNALNCEDSKYLYDVLDAKDCYDVNYSPYAPEVCYEVTSTVGLKYSAFYMAGPYNSHCFYSHMLQSCNNCFGCIGLKRKQYCIFNKQYSKEEYEILVPKIISHMQKTEEWGEFFPISFSPHGYNETVAQEYIPLSREQVERRGWPWREEKNNQSIQDSAIIFPDTLEETNDNICQQILTCEVSGKPYRIIPQELKFYLQLRIPLPRHSPAQRHIDRNASRNHRKLWNQNCKKCGIAIKTTYEPADPECIYCESCYMRAIY